MTEQNQNFPQPRPEFIPDSETGAPLPIQICKSAAGFYIGTLRHNGEPHTRESEAYWKTQKAAEHALASGAWVSRRWRPYPAFEFTLAAHLYEGADNSGHPKANYLSKLTRLSDAQLQKEAEQKIWLAASQNNNRELDSFWQRAACYDECERRGKSSLYQTAYEKAERLFVEKTHTRSRSR